MTPKTRSRDKLAQAGGSDAAPVFFFDISTDELLTVAEAARVLTISVVSVRRLQQQRRIPFVKIGGRVRFTARDLAAYIAKRRVESIGQ